MRLKDKVAIVTGAAQGIGFGVAEEFAAQGAQVVMADINKDGIETAAAKIGNSTAVHCDVGDSTQVRAMVAHAIEQHGRIDICISNAGIIRTADVLEVSEEDFDAVLRVNLKGSFLVAQACARHMVEQGAGSIVFMSSLNSVMTIPNQLPYNVSKGGMNQLTRVMANALADKGVRVNAIGPGSIMTDMLKVVMSDDEKRRQILSRTPMGRVGDVNEVAKIAVFLACEDSSYITGEIIYCDGGRQTLNYVAPVSD